MKNIIDKSWHAVAAGVLTGLLFFGIALIYKDQMRPTTSFEVTETVIEVEQQLIQETDCVEILEYDMSTGTKTVTDCIQRN